MQSNQELKPLLIYGIGNPLRGDDGVSVIFIEKCQELLSDSNQCDCIWNYQLALEDASNFSKYKTVILVDAALNLSTCYEWKEILPIQSTHFSTHGMTLPSLLFISKELYNCAPKAYTLGIKTKDFELREGLSDETKRALEEGLEFIFSKIKESNFFQN